MRRLETNRNEHKLYEEAAETFNIWLMTSFNKLQQYYDKQGSKDDIENRLIKIRVCIFNQTTVCVCVCVCVRACVCVCVFTTSFGLFMHFVS